MKRKKIRKAIKDIKAMQKTHKHWAKYFEKHSAIEKEYIATGEWDTAKEHRKIIKQYENVLNILNSILS